VSSDSTPPDRVYFIDYSLGGVAVPEALKAAGARVEIHLDHFPANMPDEQLLAEVGRRRWIFLSKDGNIRRRPLESRALMAAGVKAFILTSGNLRGHEQAEAFRAALPQIEQICAAHQGPFIARVTRMGNAEIIPDAEA
jgi:hypothetical protein